MSTEVRNLLRAVILLAGWACLWVGSSRAQTRPPVPVAADRDSSAASERSAVADNAGRSANYHLNAGDTISVRVFREPSLDTNQRISKDGTINFPLLGVIQIGGKTTNEAATLIAALLDKDYIVHPQVAVSISNYIKQKYTVLGQVGSPGSYEIPEEQTVDLLAAIAKAGGFTRLANPAKITVRRVTGGREEVFTVDGKKLMNDRESKRVLIQPNDTINVGERFL